MAFIYGQCTRAPKSPTAYLINQFFDTAEPNEFQVPPVPPLPSSYAPMLPISANLADADSFRRDLPPLPNHPRAQLGSQSSWLTSSNGSHTTITSWLYPTTHYDDTIPTASTPDFQTALATAIMHPTIPALVDAQISLILSVTLTSPLLVLNILRFLVYLTFMDQANPSKPSRLKVCLRTNGHRSGDVWLSKGDTIDGKGKLGHYSELALAQTVVVPGGATTTTNHDSAGADVLLNTTYRCYQEQMLRSIESALREQLKHLDEKYGTLKDVKERNKAKNHNKIETGVINLEGESKVALTFGQINDSEPPGAHAHVALVPVFDHRQRQLEVWSIT
ncbi:hypothetical protein BYT27DRAFT_7213104 [Phlegmacium glaucopus]|nr:hypothetical protein BYT27DRAFT_7213104 [Phlegmacium glaucopus]